MSEAPPLVSRGKRFSAIWIIPLVTLVIGVSIIVRSFMTEGPTITLDFETADGLVQGKTKVRLLSVEVGLVEQVTFKEDMSGVIATVKLERKAQSLLREDTRFWVVRARIGASGVSGLGTILAGTYIEMAPGTGPVGRRKFVGLESPPLTPVDAPGLRLALFSDRAGSVGAGDSVLYRGYKVGRVEAMSFDADRKEVRYDIFVDAPFHELIDTTTRFWDTSGVKIKATAEGVEVRTGSIDTILLGGVAFAPPPGLPPGSPVKNGRKYKLYESYDDILKHPFRYRNYYVVSFQQSMGGLVSGAPVEYRGIKIGQVERILVKELVAKNQRGAGNPIPVLIYIEPGQFGLPDNDDSVNHVEKMIEYGVANGLRATLTTGNLLTGKQVVSINYFPDEEPVELGMFEQYVVIPSIETGVERLGAQVSAFLEKLNALPLEETLAGMNMALGNADKTLASLSAALDSANSLLEGDETRAMSQSLGASVNSLNQSLENLDGLVRKLSIRPSSLLFPSPPELDPIPEARQK
ncbi:MAG: MCE family protein [Porticoccus sp.]|nr:MCE family protein [Porticoccus sp.]